MVFDGKRVLLVIGGGIAAYKSLELIRRLKERGVLVRVIMTRAAQEFITPLSVGAIAGERAFTDLFDPASEFDIGHIRLAREPDFIVVAPATADLIAKMAGGHADDLASTVLLATDKRVLIAPAMNPVMWEHPATRRNFAQVLADGILVIGPNQGEMAERGEAGPGRMAEPDEIIAAIEASLSALPDKNALSGKRVLVTSGPTHEPIDPVRFVGNRSTGKMGAALAAEAVGRGAAVTVVLGPGASAPPPGVEVVPVQTAEEMRDAVLARFEDSDAVVMAAAVADFRPKSPPNRKLKKHEGIPEIVLEPTHDFLVDLGRAKQPGQVLVGFAAETDDLLANAHEKLVAKRLDLIVANDISQPDAGFEVDTNRAYLLDADGGTQEAPLQSKIELAGVVLDRVLTLLKQKRANS
jgi:phosphopantothenoylcysteine decarboxylase/phosphopantothenate--cysteine ligase